MILISYRVKDTQNSLKKYDIDTRNNIWNQIEIKQVSRNKKNVSFTRIKMKISIILKQKIRKVLHLSAE